MSESGGYGERFGARLKRRPQTFHINNPFYSVHFYCPRATLDARAFRQSVGMPPHQWLMQHRVDPARALLLSSPLALSDIALACGFAGQSHFTRAFTRRVGTSPGAWRRQHRN